MAIKIDTTGKKYFLKILGNINYWTLRKKVGYWGTGYT